MVFVEVFRLLLVLVGVAGGLQVGNHIGSDTLAPLIAVTLGAMLGYVLGGVVGRIFDMGMREGVRRLRDMPPAEVFAGSVVGTTGLLLGLAFGLALVSLVHATVGYPLAALIAWSLCAAGARLGVAKGKEIVRAAGLGHLLERPDQIAGTALLVDTSALLERHLLPIGTAGLLAGGLVVPRFVLEEARALVDGPDIASSRRAQAGLETLDALRRSGVVVRVEESEVPEHDSTGEKALALARRLHLRLATCSAQLAEEGRDDDVEVVNLRQLAVELAPHHPTGERLAIDLVKLGRQPRQAVGYLPDGDMVVVNDAAHLVGRERVAVVVLGSRATTQGLLLFARLDQDQSLAEASATG